MTGAQVVRASRKLASLNEAAYGVLTDTDTVVANSLIVLCLFVDSVVHGLTVSVRIRRASSFVIYECKSGSRQLVRAAAGS